MKTLKAVLFAGVSICFMFSCLGCNAADDGAASPATVSGQSSKKTASLESDLPVALNISHLYEEFSLKTYWPTADCVVEATYLGDEDLIAARAVCDEGVMFFTDRHFTVDDIFFCDERYCPTPRKIGDRITVRSQGGEGELVRILNENTPCFVKGERYVLFLARNLDGSWWNTAGDHMYLSGEDLSVMRPYGESFVADNGIRATRSELHACEDRYPHDEQRHNAAENHLKESTEQAEAGEIPQEAVDEYRRVHTLETSRYAQILTPEEQRRYEMEQLRSISLLSLNRN